MRHLTNAQARVLVESAMKSLLDPQQSADDLTRYFAPDYSQWVDGKALDFTSFIDHARVLKTHLRGGTANIESLVVEGDTIADIHVIDAEKTDGSRIRTRVIAFFTVRHGKIVRCDELTHLLEGAENDRDMGSRTSLAPECRA